MQIVAFSGMVIKNEWVDFVEMLLGHFKQLLNYLTNKFVFVMSDQ